MGAAPQTMHTSEAGSGVQISGSMTCVGNTRSRQGAPEVVVPSNLAGRCTCGAMVLCMARIDQLRLVIPQRTARSTSADASHVCWHCRYRAAVVCEHQSIPKALRPEQTAELGHCSTSYEGLLCLR